MDAVRDDHATTDLAGTYCEQDFVNYLDDQPAQERYGVYAHMKERFCNAATAYLDASFFENQVWVSGPPPGIQTTVPHNTDQIALPAYLCDWLRNPNDPFVQKRLAQRRVLKA